MYSGQRIIYTARQAELNRGSDHGFKRNPARRGAAEMSIAMLMSGTIGWLVVSSQQSPFNVVFFRCIFGGATLALVCAVLGLFRRKLFSWKMLGLALLGGAAIVINWVLL